MRALLGVLLFACGAPSQPARPAGPLEQATTAALAAATIDWPSPPKLPAPKGTWRVDLEYAQWQGRPSTVSVDATGVYVTGPVFDPKTVEVRRWGVAKLDLATGKPLWSVLDDVPNGPMPEHLIVTGGAVFVGGNESNYAETRVLVIERRDAATGALVWRARVPEADRGSKFSLGGIAVRGESLYYAATLEAGQPRALFGELALATGKPTRKPYWIDGRRGRQIAVDASGLYLISDDTENRNRIDKLDPTWKPMWLVPASTFLRSDFDGKELVGWFTEIVKYEPDGIRRWSSPLTGAFVDIAIDPSGIYLTALLDASTDPYYAVAMLDRDTGKVAWLQRTAHYKEDRPSLGIAVDAEAMYLFGYIGDRWFVERRRKADGALGNVDAQLHVLRPREAPTLAR